VTKKRRHIRLSWKREILTKQLMKCASCGRTITLDAYTLRSWKKILGHYPDKSVPSKAYFHHVKPHAAGGETNPSNLVAICGLCHRKRHHGYAVYQKRRNENADTKTLL